MFEPEKSSGAGTGAGSTVAVGPDVDAGVDAWLDDEPLSEAELVKLARVARARLDRMFPRTGPGRSARRFYQSQRDARARRTARRIVRPDRRSAWSFGVREYGTERSASALPGVTPGPALAAAISDLDLARLSEHDLVHVVTATERLASWAGATQAEAIGVLASREPYDLDPPPGRSHRQVPPGIDPGDLDQIEAWQREIECVRATAAEIGAALRLSRPSAEARVWTARALTRRHPATLAALRDGAIDGPRSRVIVDELDPATTGLTTRDARRVEDAVLDKAQRLTAPRLRSLLRSERIRLAPSTAEAEHQKAVTGRRVEFSPGEAGMGWLRAHLPADAIAAIRAALDAAGDRLKTADQTAARAHTTNHPGCTSGPQVRTLDQARADALAEMAWLALDTGHLGGCPAGTKLAHPRGHRPRVQVTVSATTLRGEDDHPGHLDGYGPVPATVARAIAARGDWYRILTDPCSGTVLDVGTTRYDPPADLALHVATRDRTCRGPGCGQPAHRSDLDHTIEHPVGPTAHDNLGPLCRHHHLSKHRRGWLLIQPRPGHFAWTSPAGHTHQIAPEQVGPIRAQLEQEARIAEQQERTAAAAKERARRVGTDPPPGRTRWYADDAEPPF